MTTPKPKPKPAPLRPIDDGRLLKRSALFISITQGAGKPMVYGSQKPGAK